MQREGEAPAGRRLNKQHGGRPDTWKRSLVRRRIQNLCGGRGSDVVAEHREWELLYLGTLGNCLLGQGGTGGDMSEGSFYLLEQRGGDACAHAARDRVEALPVVEK